jgi:hypothetical protein
MAFCGFIQANTQTKVVVGPFVDKTDGLTPETAISLSTADEAEIIKHDAASVTDISSATWAAITSADGYYNLTITTSLSDTEGLLTVVVQDDSECLPVRCTFMVLAQAAWASLFTAKDAGFMDANVKTIGRTDTQETEASNLESACSNYSATRGLAGTALPAAAADAAGGLPISDAGGLDLDAQIGTDIDAILVDTGTTLQAEVDGIQADTEDIQARLPAALVSGRIDASVGAVANNAITAAAIADAAIDNATFASDVGSTAHASNMISLAARKGLDDYDPPTKAEMDAGLAALNDITVAEILAGVIDGAVDLQTAMKQVLAKASGNIAKSGNAYAYKDRAGNTLFTLTIATDSVTRS